MNTDLTHLYRSSAQYRPRLRSVAFVGLLWLALLNLVACSSTRAPIDAEAIDAEFFAHHLECDESGVRTYFDYLTTRVRAPFKDRLTSTPRVRVVSSPRLFAASLPSGTTVVSSTMVRSLSNEAELAFVVAHELAHQALGHHDFSLESSSARNRAEQAADALAVGVIAIAGYDPRASISAVGSALRRESLDEMNNSSHEDGDGRIRLLADQIRNSGWRPPGVIDRREFHIVQERLIRCKSGN